MIQGIALALTVAAVSTSATAQTNKQTLQELLAPHYAKTNPNVPLAPPIANPAQPMTAAPTSTEILRNFQGKVERGGYGCPSIVAAHPLGDDEYGRPEFLVACLVATGGAYYRVVFPPTGPAIVRPDKF